MKSQPSESVPPESDLKIEFKDTANESQESPPSLHRLKKPKLKFLDEEEPESLESQMKKTTLLTTSEKKMQLDNFEPNNDAGDETNVKDKESNKENTKGNTAPKEKNKRKSTKSAPATNPKAKKEEDENLFINVEQENKQTVLNMDDFDDKTPIWATKEGCRDKAKRRPSDPEYDPTTLYIPPEEKQKLTPTMRQFWELKSDNFDKVLFFKLGKFYELFYEDAFIGNQELDLNWMGRKMHCGFPEKALERYADQLVGRGYKVAVIEQMETPKEMEERLKKNLKKSGKKEEKTIQRSLVEVMTKGTYVSANQDTQGLEAKYLLVVRQGVGSEVSFCSLESISNFITLGFIKDDANFTHFKTLVCQLKPTEVVYDPENLNSVVLKVMKSALLSPVLSPMANSKANKWHPGTSYNLLEKTFGEDQNKWPPNLVYFYQAKQIRELVFSALSGCLSYLEQVLILDKVLVAARFSKYDPEIGLRTAMLLDSQALQHLEIFETGAFKQNTEGTLFKYLDRTASPMGRRMLRRWLCAPLLGKTNIEQRLNAIEDLQRNCHLRDSLQKGLRELPDLERLCAKVYQYSIRKTGKIVYFEDVSTLRLREFKSLLGYLIKAESLILDFQGVSDGFNSERLRRLVNYAVETDKFNDPAFQDIYMEDSEVGQEIEKEPGLLPPVSTIVTDLGKSIVWEGKDQNIPTPGPGLIESYDVSREKKKEIEKKLQDYLKTVRKRFGDHTIDYCHAKFRYELEIPERHVKGTKKPEEFEFTSARKDFQRFLTEEIREWVRQIEDIEDVMKVDLKGFAEDVFRYFRENYRSLDAFLAILAELDVLCAFSLVSFSADGVMCRPEVIDYDETKGPFIELIGARHPCLNAIDFIANDILLGNCAQTPHGQQKNLMLLTGPNMGGKSTVLRMTSVCSIMAQLGCYIPAKALRFTAIDRIFTRLGASDKLLEGKSTFFIEMEETANILQSGTVRSLAILDELGRGTSTFDGVALAYSVLKHLLENLRCLSIFATHYHVLIEEFRMFPEIEFFHMAAEVDEVNERVQFLYKLREGECHQSFGLNVAKVMILLENKRFFLIFFIK